MCYMLHPSHSSWFNDPNNILEVNAEKTKYMIMSQGMIARQNHNIKIDSKSFERVEQFKYLGTTNQNSIQEEIMFVFGTTAPSGPGPPYLWGF